MEMARILFCIVGHPHHSEGPSLASLVTKQQPKQAVEIESVRLGSSLLPIDLDARGIDHPVLDAVGLLCGACRQAPTFELILHGSSRDGLAPAGRFREAEGGSLGDLLSVPVRDRSPDAACAPLRDEVEHLVGGSF